jgi:hypothetical protein
VGVWDHCRSGNYSWPIVSTSRIQDNNIDGIVGLTGSTFRKIQPRRRHCEEVCRFCCGGSSSHSCKG